MDQARADVFDGSKDGRFKGRVGERSGVEGCAGHVESAAASIARQLEPVASARRVQERHRPLRLFESHAGQELRGHSPEPRRRRGGQEVQDGRRECRDASGGERRIKVVAPSVRGSVEEAITSGGDALGAQDAEDRSDRTHGARQRGLRAAITCS
jgi:hypothetical protein